MELKFIILMIIKILISIPTIVMLLPSEVEGAALMGGHLNNNSTQIANLTTNSYSVDFQETQDLSHNNTKQNPIREDDYYISESEEVPDPSPLVVPGYNLPENIFNEGKPFYLEKDPLTGQVDFSTKTEPSKLADEVYDYFEDEPPPHPDIFKKENIDRRDGPISSHNHADVNQLTPNFHDFLNLPVKYNPDKYVYPLISSSYANTKVQGNVNKYDNHKNYVATTYKPIVSPTYFYTTRNSYFQPSSQATTTTTTKPTTTTSKSTEHIYFTTSKQPLMESPLNHPSYDETAPVKVTKPNKEIFITTPNPREVYLTSKTTFDPTTTKRTLSLFEQLFGEYDDVKATEKPPKLFVNLPSNRNKTSTTTSTVKTPTSTFENVLSGSAMGQDMYEYEDYSSEVNPEDNIAVESKLSKQEEKPVKHVYPEKVPPKVEEIKNNTVVVMNTTISTTLKRNNTDYVFAVKENYTTPFYKEEVTTASSTTLRVTSLPLGESFGGKVTSLPLGENHISQPSTPSTPFIAVAHNLREQLNNEKVDKKPLQPAPSTSNIHIAPDQDTVSFVVGNQQSVEGSQYVGTSFKESPYDSNPFRPLIMDQSQAGSKNSVSYTVQASPAFAQKLKKPLETGTASVSIQPSANAETSLSIGTPISGGNTKPGQVVSENLGSGQKGSKIVFPKEEKEIPLLTKPQQPIYQGLPQPQPVPPPQTVPTPQYVKPLLSRPPPSREILKLSSKPMLHQLPSDLTPPNEQDVPPPRMDRPRPPWDPRPGHFYNGRPEYSRPPRPQPQEVYKKVDNLPNILPQFRPNAKVSNGPYFFDMGPKHGYPRQPLLERPSNRPVGFYEKLLPPPPPPKNLHSLRKGLPIEHEKPIINSVDRIGLDPKKAGQDQFNFYQSPPKVALSHRRSGEPMGIETLQMIQAKQDKKEQIKTSATSGFKTNLNGKDTTEKPLYVVYPVNSAPIKLDVLDSDKKETVVVGTRAELPLPPSKINQEFKNQEFDYEAQNRHEAPILKPHPKPPNFPIKSDFPYPLERPDFEENRRPDQGISSSNQWNLIGGDTEARIVTGGSKINYKTPANQISATLKTYTEKPIAVAYTPTETHFLLENTEKYSMPNYAGPVISEIRPGVLDKSGSEITVSAVMHTHPQMGGTVQHVSPTISNHKISEDTEDYTPVKLDFQAPFQASVSVDSQSQGWSVVRDNKPSIDRSDEETTTLPVPTTSEFDIENFKPELFGGFKPIYTNAEEEAKSSAATEITDRQERKLA